jgi:hypothetical protein
LKSFECCMNGVQKHQEEREKDWFDVDRPFIQQNQQLIN